MSHDALLLRFVVLWLLFISTSFRILVSLTKTQNVLQY